MNTARSASMARPWAVLALLLLLALTALPPKAPASTPSLPAVSPQNLIVREGSDQNTTAFFPVLVAPPPTTDLTIPFQTLEGSARAGSDFIHRAGTLVIPAGASSATLPITIVADRLAESVETFEIDFLPSPAFTLTHRRAVATVIDDDIPEVSVQDVTASEDDATDGPVRVPVSLSIPSAIPVRVRVSLFEDSARAFLDYLPTTATIEFAPGSQLEFFDFPLVADNTAEFDERIGVRLSDPVNAVLANNATAHVLVHDDDTIPAIQVVGGTVAETTGPHASLDFQILLSGPSPLPVRIAYATRSGTASVGADYLSRFGTLLIPAGETQATLSVTILGDDLAEPDETVFLVLRNPENATLETAEAVGTILDDDRRLTVSVSDAAAWEGSASSPGQLAFTVSLSHPTTNIVTVRYVAESDTATLGTDFQPTQGTLAFVPIGVGSTQHVVRVSLVGDDLPEPNETLRLRIEAPDHAELGRSEGIGSILNDDGSVLLIDDVAVTEGDSGLTPAQFTVRRLGPALDTVTATYATFGGTAQPDLDFVPASGSISFPPGQTRASITVLVRGDLLEESDEAFEVRLLEADGATLLRASATATILDDDLPNLRVASAQVTEGSEGPTTSRFIVRLDSPSTLEVSVDYSLEPGTATADEDYIPTSGTLSFPPGVREREIAVEIIGDTLDEEDEAFSLVLARARSATIAAGTATITILDDDPVPFLSIEDAEARECTGDGPPTHLVFPVRLSSPSGRTIEVALQTRPLTALDGLDYVGGHAPVVFPPGSTRQEIRIPLVCDTEDERDEFFEIILGPPSHAVLSRARARGRILDDDLPTLFIEDVTTQEGTSEATSAIVTVTLSSPALEVIQVQYATVDGSASANHDYSPVSQTLLLLPGTTRETIRIPILPDHLPEADEVFRLVFTNPANVVLDRDHAVVTILDDDPPILTAADLTHPTPQQSTPTTATVTFTLSNPPPRPARVGYRTLPDTALADADFTETSGVLLFPAGTNTVSLAISIAGNLPGEGDEGFWVELHTPEGMTLDRTRVRITLQALAPPNQPPRITLRTPPPNLEVEAGTPIELLADAEDPENALASVAFLAGTNRLGTRTLPPFTLTWTHKVPGAYTLSAVATDAGGLSATSAPVAVRLVEPVVVTNNLPPVVALLSPGDLQIITPGQPFILQADAADPDGPGPGVEFIVDDTVVGSAASPPYRWTWTFPTPGEHRIQARAVDNHGASTLSDTRRVAVAESCGRTAIIATVQDDEIRKLREYLFELGLPATVYDRATVETNDLAGHDLVIWHDGGLPGVTPADLHHLESVTAAGTPLYVIGEHLVESLGNLDSLQQARWLRLVLIRPGPPGAIPDRVDIQEDAVFSSAAAIVRSGKVGDVQSFDYPFSNPVSSRPEPGRETVLATAGGADVLVALSADDLIPPARRVSQAFLVARGGTGASRTERKRLFQNAVWWLLRCSLCSNLNVAVEASFAPASDTPTDDLLVNIRIPASGACAALGVHATCTLSDHLRAVSTETDRGIAFIEPDGRSVRFQLGSLASADFATLQVRVRPVRSGDAGAEIRVESLNEGPGALGDNLARLVTAVAGPPSLTIIRRAAASIDLAVQGTPGNTLRIESSPSLNGPWRDTWTITPEQPETFIHVRVLPEDAPRFFRIQRP